MNPQDQIKEIYISLISYHELMGKKIADIERLIEKKPSIRKRTREERIAEIKKNRLAQKIKRAERINSKQSL